MNCPACASVALQMTDRQGVEIDYCPKCRGVWLDRGELDKLIERSATVQRVDDDDDDDRWKKQQKYQQPGYAPPGVPPAPGGYHPGSVPYQKPYKKKSLLGELFDF
ncbi:MAG: zf-TFIIB domain-containing protein [Phycisphaerales bacterium]